MYTLVLQWFDAAADHDQQPAGAAVKRKKTTTAKSLRCKACGHIITSHDEKISVNDSHQHTCRNPAGYVFTFGCFRDAPGCRVIGPASSEHTWFPGYRWQLAVCASCSEHLGWLFSNHDRFYALIAGKLKS